VRGLAIAVVPQPALVARGYRAKVLTASNVTRRGIGSMKLPPLGTAAEDLLARMGDRKRDDADWRDLRMFSSIYPAGDDVAEVLRQANALYVFDNALNARLFPSLRAMESEVVEMTADLLHAGVHGTGCMTSGGTESIMVAVKAARDRAQVERGVRQPVMLVPASAHPAFAKAGKFLGVAVHQIPLDSDRRADAGAAAAMVCAQTVMIAGSAPCYPYGVIDPIEELASLAQDNGIHFHSDACVGGFLLPFWERVGESVPAFDFRVAGVTTMSADVHKFGYSTKGASVIVHRDEAGFDYQKFHYEGWPGGRYGSDAVAGARPAAPIAAAWAVMNYLGYSGYERLARQLCNAVRAMRQGVDAIPGLEILGDPQASILPLVSDGFDIMAVGDVMDDRGWHLSRQTDPPALHMVLSPGHGVIVDELLRDLGAAATTHVASRGEEARYS